MKEVDRRRMFELDRQKMSDFRISLSSILSEVDLLDAENVNLRCENARLAEVIQTETMMSFDPRFVRQEVHKVAENAAARSLVRELVSRDLVQFDHKVVGPEGEVEQQVLVTRATIRVEKPIMEKDNEGN